MQQTLVSRDSWEGTAATGEGYMHLIIPGNWRLHSREQCQQLAGQLKDLSECIRSCEVSQTGEIYVVIYSHAGDAEHLGVLQAILQYLSAQGLHDPALGLKSYVPGLR